MIGIFDSGVGGLTVVKEVFRRLPKHQIIYFGDTARLPYGTKGADFVKKYSEKITQWLLDKGAKVIVVACNTSSAWASDFLREKFPGVPIFEMIEPAVAQATKFVDAKRKRIGVIGTPGTIKSNVYSKKLSAKDAEFTIFSKACPLFVPLVEEGLVEDKITQIVAKKYLSELKDRDIDALILGCTHYPLLENLISKVMGKNVAIINPAKAIVDNLAEFLENNPGIDQGIKKGIDHYFYFSDDPYNFEKISHLCFDKSIKPIILDPFNA